MYECERGLTGGLREEWLCECGSGVPRDGLFLGRVNFVTASGFSEQSY